MKVFLLYFYLKFDSRESYNSHKKLFNALISVCVMR